MVLFSFISKQQLFSRIKIIIFVSMFSGLKGGEKSCILRCITVDEESSVLPFQAWQCNSQSHTTSVCMVKEPGKSSSSHKKCCLLMTFQGHAPRWCQEWVWWLVWHRGRWGAVIHLSCVCWEFPALPGSHSHAPSWGHVTLGHISRFIQA